MSEAATAGRTARPRGCLRFGLKTLLLVPLLIGGVLWGVYMWPKSQRLVSNDFRWIGYYRGLGISDGPGFLGRDYYHVTWDATDMEVGAFRREVDIRRPGYNRFRAYYKNDVLAEEGECFVDDWDEYGPFPAFLKVQWCKCYKPDGSLGSEVNNGTGTLTQWYLNGKKEQEYELSNGEIVRIRWWYENGQLRVDEKRLNGERHGFFVVWHRNGTMSEEAQYTNGVRTGKVQHYNESGVLTRVDEYDETGAIVSTTEFSTSAPAAGDSGN